MMVLMDNTNTASAAPKLTAPQARSLAIVREHGAVSYTMYDAVERCSHKGCNILSMHKLVKLGLLSVAGGWAGTHTITHRTAHAVRHAGGATTEVRVWTKTFTLSA